MITERKLMRNPIVYEYGSFESDNFNDLVNKIQSGNKEILIGRGQLIYLLQYLNDEDHYIFCEYCGKFRDWEEKKCECETDE